MERDPLPEPTSAAELEKGFLKDDDWMDADIEQNMLDVTEPYHAPKYTLSWDGVKFAPIGGLHVITGQSGNGKTFTFTQMIVAILRGEYQGLRYELSDEIPSPTVLYIDTEQEKENTKLVNLRIYEMMGWTFHQPHPEFRIMCLREEEKAIDRWRKVLKAIDTLRPTVCFLDGNLDIVADFNDNKECSELVYKEMKVASHYGMSFWVLVHENPGSNKMVGHLGSILQRKVTDELCSKKEKNEDTGEATFTIKQKKTRGKDMKAWKFRIVDGPHSFGIPMIEGEEETPEPTAAEDETFDIYNVTDEQLSRFEFLITSPDGMTTRELREQVKQTFKIGAVKADKIIQMACDKEIITRGENKRYYLYDKTCKSQELDF